MFGSSWAWYEGNLFAGTMLESLQFDGQNKRHKLKMVEQIFQSRLLFGHYPSIMQSIWSNGLTQKSNPPQMKPN